MFISHRGVAIYSALIGVALTGIVALGLPARADVEVMSSTVPEIAKGTVLEDDAVFKIPEGAEVLLVRTPQGTTHMLSGPFEGTLEDYETRNTCSALERFLGLCDDESEVPTGPTGGVRGVVPPPVGGVRGVR